MVERHDLEFEVDGDDRLRGWLFTPEAGTLSCPAISMSHGLSRQNECQAQSVPILSDKAARQLSGWQRWNEAKHRG